MARASGILGLLLIGALWLPGNPAFGQEISEDARRNSHGPIPGNRYLNLPQALSQRMRAAKQLSEAENFMQESRANENFIRELLKKLDNLPPEEKARLDSFLEAYKKEKIEVPEYLLKQLKVAQQDLGSGGFPPEFGKIIEKEDFRRLNGSSADSTGSPASPPEGSSSKPASTDSQIDLNMNSLRERDSGAVKDEHTSKAMDWFLKQLEKSPELQELAESFRRDYLNSGRMPLGSLGDTWGDNLAQIVRPILPDSEFWMAKVVPHLRNMPLPSLSGLNVPEFKISTPSLPSLDAPSLGVPSVSTAKTGMGLLLLPVLVIFGLVVWRLIRNRNLRKLASWQLQRGAANESMPGPWPVRLNALRTNEDVIRAFEYLSLLKLGNEARHWNHRNIARELGRDSLDRRRSAEHLAVLYERARYAPGTQRFSPDVLRTAGHELSLLAGEPL
jgi:hypothetical protein